MSTLDAEKRGLFDRGVILVSMWCMLNGVTIPEIRTGNFARHENPATFNTCAYYRNNTIFINIARCSGIGRAGRQWSYPGYVVDRTPGARST